MNKKKLYNPNQPLDLTRKFSRDIEYEDTGRKQEGGTIDSILPYHTFTEYDRSVKQYGGKAIAQGGYPNNIYDIPNEWELSNYEGLMNNPTSQAGNALGKEGVDSLSQAGESAGGAGGGIGGMTSYAGLSEALGTGINKMAYSSKGEKDPRDQGWQQTKAAVAKSNPYAQLFYGIDEGLQGFGKMVGGTKGQRAVQFFTDPIGFIVNRGALYKEGEEKRMKEVNEFNAKYNNGNNYDIQEGNYLAEEGFNLSEENQDINSEELINSIFQDFDMFLNSSQSPEGNFMQQGGTTKPNNPIYTTNPNDPRLRMYNDSLLLHNLSEKQRLKGTNNKENILFNGEGSDPLDNRQREWYKSTRNQFLGKFFPNSEVAILVQGKDDRENPSSKENDYNNDEYFHPTIKPTKGYNWSAATGAKRLLESNDNFLYKKPTQPIVYKNNQTQSQTKFQQINPIVPEVLLRKKEPIVQLEKKELSSIPTSSSVSNIQLKPGTPIQERPKGNFLITTQDKPMRFERKEDYQDVLDLLKTQGLTPKSKSELANGKEASANFAGTYDTLMKWMEGKYQGTPAYEYGGQIITDSEGQYKYPGQITRIPSNSITMRNIKYPILGISDKGDTQLMMPNEDYMFDGNYVTEYPLNKSKKKLKSSKKK